MEIGYEATTADLSYSCKVFENVGLKFKFKGYNDKLPVFVEKFVQLFYRLGSHGIS